ncbi:MAG TPA: Rpn family recombination-promoting nuclease/putative transposase [Blastocatellia bacterium]|nr:Rpn family recombination-promoting nuclease/putative transposase [Blastocatellia bacterium]
MPSRSNIHDRFSKAMLSQPEAAADFFTNYLPPKLARALNLTDPKLSKDSFVDSDLKEYFSDLLYRVRAGARDAFVYVLIEHKSAPNEWVAFQILRYMVKIWEPIAKKRGRRLPPIIPIVLYHGMTKWRVARNFAALVDLEELESLRECVPDFVCQVCDLSDYAVDELRGNLNLRLALLAMKNVFRPDQRQRIEELLEAAKTLPVEDGNGLEYLLTVLMYYTSAARGLRGDDFRAAVRKVLPRQEGRIMSTAVEDWIKEGRLKGLKEGVEKGLKEGVEKGLKEGIHRGTADLTLLQLQRRLGKLSGTARKRILSLRAAELQELGIALLDFNSPKDLSTWLAKRA